MSIMDKEQLTQAGIDYENALVMGDYEEALKVNHLIYGSEYLRYRNLLDIKKNVLQRREEIDLGNLISDLDSKIEIIKENLETLMEGAEAHKEEGK